MSGASRNAQMAVTQLTFAVDDAVNVFGTSGWTGALRAAQNNLTMLAASLGGVKAMMVAVAAFAAIQLAKSLMGIKDAAQVAGDELKRMAENAELFKKAMDRLDELSDLAAGPESFKTVGEVGDAFDAVTKRIEETTKQMSRLDDEFNLVAQQNADFQRENPADAPWWQPFNAGRSEEEQKVIDAYNERLNAIQKEQGHLKEVTKELERQKSELEAQRMNLEAIAAAQERAVQQRDREHAAARQVEIEQQIQRSAAHGLDELDKRLDSILNPKDAEINDILEETKKQIQAVMDAVGAGILDQAGAEELLDEIQDAAEKQTKALNAIDSGLLNRLPSAATFGSSAAVSAINQATSGAKNVQDQQRLLNASERTARAAERTRELLENAQGDLTHTVPVL